MNAPAPEPLSVLDIDSEFLRVDRCRHGVFVSLKSDVYIGRSLAAYGEWCEDEIGLLAQLLRPGDIVVDAGANVGSHAVAFARIVGPEGRVYAFEPQPVIHQLLATNAVLNGQWHLSTINAGLSDERDWIPFPEIKYDKAHNFGGLSLDWVREASRKSLGIRRQQIPMAPLDALLTLDRLRLIKADVEGMEAALLRGARETLRRLKPVLYLECGQPEHAAPMFEALNGLDYRCHWHVSPLFRHNNWKGEAQDIFSNLANVNMLCVPPEMNVKGLAPASGPEDHPRAKRSNRTR